MASEQPGENEQLPAREAARVRHRDRKRRTEMVVDNAGVKRIVLHRAERRRVRRSPDPVQHGQG
jgi:hypothetical protein